ncbi:annexin anxc4 [Stemphylium lycopersici]|uniref:Annexin anxc4 n=1 Tax=Stemphylium lycopersici TaxID=183478 RepID=A0A364MWF6_STELY|nr:annexin anxc4 [Stemphylium lycopersici]
MSLRPDKGSRRSRSKSPGRGRDGDRSRSRSHAREPQLYGAADGASTPQYEIRQPGQQYATPASEPITMGNYSDLPHNQRPGYQPHAASFAHPATTAPPATNIAYAQANNVQYAPTANNFSYTAAPASSNAHARTQSGTSRDGAFQYANPPASITYTAKPVAGSSNQPPHVRHNSQPSYPSPTQPQYTAVSQAPPSPKYATTTQAPQSQHQYAPMPPAPAPAPPSATHQSFPPPPMGAHSSPRPEHHRASSYSGPMSTHDGRNVVEMRPQGHLGGPDRPEELRMDRLSVSGNRPDLQIISPSGMPGGYPGGVLPPPSPMLEAYHGTYQSISPMPQIIRPDDDIDHLQPLDTLESRASSRSRHSSRRRAHSSASRRSPSPSKHAKPDKLALAAYGGRSSRQKEKEREKEKEKEKRRVRIYDATDDALALTDALAARTPNVDTIVDILPILSHDQMLELRAEYKRHCKVQGRGINIAKHIKLKTNGNFGKVAYVTALGKYESEGYWANYWYQSNSARRELLIEALMGRQNHEIREIKDTFKDKRYSDDLTRCMDKELKADKFRKAVLMALEAERQEESDVWPVEYRNRDVDTLYKAIRLREGGESTMLSVVVMRSDAHLREVLRTYEMKYQGNFARDALKKSNNLVGEVIAHILNGVINRPARDAMLLHHALTDLMEPVMEARSGRLSAREAASNKHDRQQRVELLISRLVRLHWDRLHFARVLREYGEKYRREVEEDIEEATRSDFRMFCLALCQSAR